MKKSFLFLTLFSLAGWLSAQKETVSIDGIIAKTKAEDTIKWKRSLEIGLNSALSNFSDNWTGGGVSSFTWGSLLNGKIEYKNQKFTWFNDLQLQYGKTQNKGQSARKSQDLIFFDSKVGYNINKKWDFFGAVNFISQFDNGFTYGTDSLGNETATVISKFMSPGYLTEAIGLRYQPVDYFWARIGVIAFRQTFVTDTSLYQNVPNNYGVSIGKRMLNQPGAQILSEFKKNLAPNITLLVRYLGFAPYQDLNLFSHRIDAVLTAKITKYINLSVTGIGIYDPSQDVNWQTSTVVSLGLLFQLK